MPLRSGWQALYRFRRAEQLPGEYVAKTRHIDRGYYGVAGDCVGPVEAKLGSFDEVRGLIFRR